jgi:hypothetical protein
MQNELNRELNFRKKNKPGFSLFSADIRKTGSEMIFRLVFFRIFCPGINLELGTGSWRKALQT